MPTAKRVVLYLRLSRATETSTAIAGQNAELREYATRQGWEVVRVLEDDGRSGRKQRAHADECLRMLEAREADILAVYAVDRWTRQGLEAVGELCGVLRRSGAEFFALRESLSSAEVDTFELTLGIHASIAKREGELIAGRAAASRKRLDAAGRFGGGMVPWGYRPAPASDGVGRVLALDPVEVAVIRETIDAVLDGTPLTRIVRRLTEAGVPTPRSAARVASFKGEPTEGLKRGTWSVYNLRLALCSEALLGQVPRRTSGLADVERDADGAPVQRWEPVTDRATLTRLQARLRDPRPRANAAPTPRRAKRAARLLSGIARCAECGGTLYVGSSGSTATGRGVATYRCPRRGGGVECSVPSVTAENLERVVVEAFLRLYGRTPEVELVEVVSDPGAADELASVEHDLAGAAAAIIRPGADRTALLKRIDALSARAETLRAIKPTVTVQRRRTGRTLASAWHATEDLDIDARRRLLRERLAHVDLSPRDPSAPRGVFDEDRVAYHWIEYGPEGTSTGPGDPAKRRAPRAARAVA